MWHHLRSGKPKPNQVLRIQQDPTWRRIFFYQVFWIVDMDISICLIDAKSTKNFFDYTFVVTRFAMPILTCGAPSEIWLLSLEILLSLLSYWRYFKHRVFAISIFWLVGFLLWFVKYFCYRNLHICCHDNGKSYFYGMYYFPSPLIFLTNKKPRNFFIGYNFFTYFFNSLYTNSKSNNFILPLFLFKCSVS